jgi:tetratricopeptide (TPR) repeat protein
MNISISHKPYVHILLIILAALIAYSNTFDVPFDFDDKHNIVNNPKIKDFDYSKIGRRYLGELSFALNYKVHGTDVTGYHIVNLIIHMINGLLVCLLGRLTLRTPYFWGGRNINAPPADPRIIFFSLIPALIFVTHPIETQAVTYIVQRFASLTTLFYMLSIVLYVRSRLSAQGARDIGGEDRVFSARCLPFYLLSIASAVCAMKTKEMSFTLPVIIVIYELFFFRGRTSRSVLYLIPIVLTILIIPLSLTGLDRPMGELIGDMSESTKVQTELSRSDYLVTQFRVIVTYIRLLFMPINQNLDYDYPVYSSLLTAEVLLSFILLVCIAAFGIYLLYRSRNSVSNAKLVSFGIFWFFITLSVESSIIPIEDVIFEHRLYLPSIGFFIAVSAFILMISDKLKEKRIAAGRAIIPLFAVIIVVLTGTTYARNQIWKDPVVLWKDIVSKSPGKARPHNNLGKAYWEKGLKDKAFEQYSIAVKIDPMFPQALTNIANMYRERGQLNRALQHYQMAIILSPTYTNAHFNLGLLYLQKGDTLNAYNSFRQILEINPSDVRAMQFLNYITGKSRNHQR